MYDTQTGLIEHLKTLRTLYGVKQVKKYEGELKDVAKLTGTFPALYIVFIDGEATYVYKAFNFALLLVTDNSSLNLAENQSDNLKVSQDIFDWILDNQNAFYDHNGFKYFWNTSELIPVQVLKHKSQDRYYIIDIRLTVFKN